MIFVYLRPLLFITSLLLFSGCAVLSSGRTRPALSFGGADPARSAEAIKVFSRRAVLLDVPFEAQTTPNLCGVAALEMLTRYHRLPLKPEKREALSAEAARDKGVSGESLKEALEDAGYVVAVFQGSLDRETTGIYRHIDLGRPCIVMNTAESGASHYWIVMGYDTERDLVAIVDPTRGRIAVSLENFKSGWGRANRFTLLAVPRSADPVAGKEQDKGGNI